MNEFPEGHVKVPSLELFICTLPNVFDLPEAFRYGIHLISDVPKKSSRKTGCETETAVSLSNKRLIYKLKRQTHYGIKICHVLCLPYLA